MSKSPINNQLFINDGTGQQVPIQTGAFVTQAQHIDDHRRVSFTVGFQGTTGPSLIPPTFQGGVVGGAGGFTGLLYVQTTNEVPYANGATGTPQAGAGRQPGFNGFTGALYWNNIVPNPTGLTLGASGAIQVTNATNQLQIDFTDIGAPWIRLNFNPGIASPIGSGTVHVYVSAKST